MAAAKKKKAAPKKKGRAAEPDVDAAMAKLAKTTGGALVRASIKDIAASMPEEVRNAITSAVSAADYHRHPAFTGMLHLDLLLSLIGKRTEILGKQHSGKTLLVYRILGALQRTCRLCFTPIIDWIDDYSVLLADETRWKADPCAVDFASVRRCMCGRNDRMAVLVVDAEDQWDPMWATLQGMQVGNFDAYSAIDLEAAKEKNVVWKAQRGMWMSPDERLIILRPTSSTTIEAALKPMIEGGAIDVIVIDSIAAFAIQEDVDGTAKIGSRARFLARFLPLVLSSAIVANERYGSRLTQLFTNHYIQGPTDNPRQNPNKPAGGLKTGYMVDQRLTIHSSQVNEGVEGGYKERALTRDICFQMEKARSSQLNARGATRIYLDDKTLGNGVSYRAGENDDPDLILKFLQELDDPDVFLAEKSGKAVKCYWLFGRPFQRVRDICVFLKRRDVQFVCRFIFLAKSFGTVDRMHLEIAHYAYSPFKDDPLHKVLEKYRSQTGVAVRADRSAQPAAPVARAKGTVGGFNFEK